MINRVLIRLKIVQIVYAYYQNGGKNLDTAEKELFFSLSKAYDLYNYLLLLMVEVTKQANKRLNAAKNKLVPTKEELFPNTKFVENRFIAQLEVNKQLLEFSNNQKKTWENEADFVKTLCDKILESGIYKEYMASSDNSYEYNPLTKSSSLAHVRFWLAMNSVNCLFTSNWAMNLFSTNFMLGYSSSAVGASLAFAASIRFCA